MIEQIVKEYRQNLYIHRDYQKLKLLSYDERWWKGKLAHSQVLLIPWANNNFCIEMTRTTQNNISCHLKNIWNRSWEAITKILFLQVFTEHFNRMIMKTETLDVNGRHGIPISYTLLTIILIPLRLGWPEEAPSEWNTE